MMDSVLSLQMLDSDLDAVKICLSWQSCNSQQSCKSDGSGAAGTPIEPTV